MSKTFYTVFSPLGEAPAQRVHASHPEAMAEAHRLARANPGREFFVMKSKSAPIVVAAEGGAE